jgi:hypothetical protein
MEEPGWITLLFERGQGLQAVHSPFLYRLAIGHVEGEIAGEEERRLLLRRASLRRLKANDADITQALIFLAIVGDGEDLPAVEGCIDYPSERVRKAAGICTHELKSRHS